MAMQKYISSLFLIGFLNIGRGYCSQNCRPKVAVIGAGIGGASASHFLTDLFNKNIDIDVFEDQIVGGRLATINLGNEEFEAGGAIIHPRNKYMKDFVKLLNLYPRPPSNARFGIWNGNEFVFEESSWESVTLFKLLYRYGLQPFHLYRYIDAILDDFEKIYLFQDKGIAFDNVTALLSAMNKEFVNLLEISIKDHLLNLGYSNRLIDELVEASIIVNYGQDTNVHSFVGCVSIAGAGFDLWSVKGGNKEVPKYLISHNDRVSIINSTVTKINPLYQDQKLAYEVIYGDKEKNSSNSKLYDIVIIAAPMTRDQKDQIYLNINEKFLGEYQTTIATFVSGEVNYSYFGLKDEIEGIMSCDAIATKISSIGKLSSVEGDKNNRTKVWKIFSREKLDDSIINKIFLHVDEVKEIVWKAYPKYSSDKRLDKFKIHDGLYHVNAMEWVASAMEMSAISGRNAAILAFNDYQKKCSFPTISKNFAKDENHNYSEL